MGSRDRELIAADEISSLKEHTSLEESHPDGGFLPQLVKSALCGIRARTAWGLLGTCQVPRQERTGTWGSESDRCPEPLLAAGPRRGSAPLVLRGVYTRLGELPGGPGGLISQPWVSVTRLCPILGVKGSMFGLERLEDPRTAASTCSGATLAEEEARTGASRGYSPNSRSLFLCLQKHIERVSSCVQMPHLQVPPSSPRPGILQR